MISRAKIIALSIITSLLLVVQSAHAEIALTNARITDVTPSSFSVIWYTDQQSTPSVRIYTDMDGTVEVTSDYELSSYPIQGPISDFANRYEYRQSRKTFIDGMNALGFNHVRVEGLDPSTTYYVKLFSQNDTDNGS